jgi:hypothetical protein
MEERKQTFNFRPAQGFSIAPLLACQQTLAQQNRLLHEIKAILPAALAEHARHCVYSQQQLTLYTDHAGWASQLRFYQAAIVDATQALLPLPVRALRVRLLPRAPLQRTRKPIVPSAELVGQIFSGATPADNDELQQALHKLALTLKKRSSEQ